MYYYKLNHDCYDHFTGTAFVKGELLTEKERHTKARYISDNAFTLIEWKKKNTYYSFGIRFQSSTLLHTKQEQSFIDEHRLSIYTTINQCYCSPSIDKQKAETHCKERCALLNGYNFRILSYNNFTFSCGYKYNNLKTGYVHLMVHTGYNTYDIPLARINMYKL